MFTRVLRSAIFSCILMVGFIIPQPNSQAAQANFFEDVFDYPLHEYRVENLGAADFDKNGFKDLVFLALYTERIAPGDTHIYTKLVLLRGNGNWQYSEQVLAQYPKDEYGYWLDAADMNNDGWPDIVVQLENNCLVYLNDKAGGFSQGWVGTSGWAMDFDLADMNGDGFLDILFGTQWWNGGVIKVFLNNGTATSFTQSWESKPYGDTNAGTIHNILAVNLNDDDFPDIAAVEIYDGVLLTFLGDGTGHNFTEKTVLSLGEQTFSLAAGDINHDGLTDLAAFVGWGKGKVFITQSNGSSSEGWSTPMLTDASFNTALTDFDHDGWLDYFAETFSDGNIWIYLGRSGSQFAQIWHSTLPGIGRGGMPADLDDDGFPDLIVSWQDANKQSTLRIMHNLLTSPVLVPVCYLPIVMR